MNLLSRKMHNGMVLVVFIYNVLIDNSFIWYTFCINICLFYFVCYNTCVLHWVFVVLNLWIALKEVTHPESFVRGKFLFALVIILYRGRRVQNQYSKRATCIIGQPAKRHLNGVSLVGRWWRGVPVGIRNPSSLWIRALT